MKLLLALAIALGLASLPTEQVAACSCMQVGPEEAARNADVAFAGSVIGERPIGRDEAPGRPVAATVPMPGVIGQIVYTFDVDGVAKGDVGSRVDVLGSGDGASCGMTFGSGERWLVFATFDGTMLATNLCSGNLPLGPNDEPPIALAAPTGSDADDDSAPTDVPWTLIGVLGFIGVFTAVSWLAFRREPNSPVS